MKCKYTNHNYCCYKFMCSLLYLAQSFGKSEGYFTIGATSPWAPYFLFSCALRAFGCSLLLSNTRPDVYLSGSGHISICKTTKLLREDMNDFLIFDNVQLYRYIVQVNDNPNMLFTPLKKYIVYTCVRISQNNYS